MNMTGILYPKELSCSATPGEWSIVFLADACVELYRRAILHDPEVYADPDAFNPDRYLKDGQLDRDVEDPDCAFGFGRRWAIIHTRYPNFLYDTNLLLL